MSEQNYQRFYCPDCEEMLTPSRDAHYNRIYHCSRCHVDWNKDLTKKATEWKDGSPVWRDRD